MNCAFVQKKGVMLVGLVFAASALQARHDPSNGENILVQAHQLYCNGSYWQARQAYQEVFEQIALGTLSLDNNVEIDAHTNYGQILWALGDYRNGHIEFDYRLQHPDKEPLQKPLTEEIVQKLKDDNALGNITLLVRAEHGLGDTFGFMKWLKAFKDAGVTVLLKVQNPLKGLLCRSHECVSLVINDEDDEPPFDYDMYLMSAPRYTSKHGLVPTVTVDDIPHFGAYIHPLAQKVQWWKEQLQGCLPLGFKWQFSGQPVPGGRFLERQIPLGLLAQLSSVDNVRAYSLQVPPHRPIRQQEFNQRKANNALNGLNEADIVPDGYWVQTFGPDFDKEEPFEDTVAVIKAIQMLGGKIISVDTSVPNLAGAMTEYNADAGDVGDTPVIMLLADKANIDARWGEIKPGARGEISRLFNSVRIYSQDKPGDWQMVVNNLKGDLRKEAAMAT